MNYKHPSQREVDERMERLAALANKVSTALAGELLADAAIVCAICTGFTLSKTKPENRSELLRIINRMIEIGNQGGPANDP